jgi:hypothetical protein
MNKYEFAIKYEDTRLSLLNILKNYSICLLFRHIGLLPLLQIYILQADISEYSLPYFIKSLLFSITTIINEISLEYLNNYMNEKEYYKLGSIVRKIIFWSIIVSTVLFFPIMFIISILCGVEAWGFFVINFFTMILFSVNLPLFNMLYTFQKNEKILNILSISRVFVNIMFITGINRRGLSVLNTIALSDFLVELVYLVLIIIIQNHINPYPQAWINFTPDTFKIHIHYLQDVGLHSLMMLLVTYYNEISVVIHTFLYGKNIETILFLLLMKELFFNSTKYSRRLYPIISRKELTKNLLDDGLDNSKFLLQRYCDFKFASAVAVSTMGLVLSLLLVSYIGFFQILIIYCVSIIQNPVIDIVRLKVYNVTTLQVLKFGAIQLTVFIVTNMSGPNSFLFFLYNVLFIYFIINQYSKII